LSLHDALPISVTENCGQEIVEVVGVAARQLTERFHFLGMRDLVSQLFARGHIHERANEPHGAAIFVAHKQGALQQLKVMALSVSKTIFARPMLRLGFDSLANRGCDSGSIVAMNLLFPESDCLT